MALRDLFKNLSQCATPDLLEPLLKSAGIEAALLEYDPPSRHVVVALAIHGQSRFLCLPTGRKFTRSEICALIQHTSDTAIQAVVSPQANNPAAPIDPPG